MKLSQFIGKSQLSALRSLVKGEEGEFFVGKVTELKRVIASMPKVYETDGQGESAVAHLHYFMGGFDWYITERDYDGEQYQAFGLADLGYGLELGYISIQEIISHGAELDLYFQPKTVGEILAKRAA